MFCPQCGSSVPDGASFCATCGASVAVSAPVADPVPAQQPQQAPGNPQYVYVPAPKGCVSQAWSDITSSPNWIKRILLLMIMNCVPVLSLYTNGYIMQWGAEAAHGKGESLPVGTFNRKTILYGLIPVMLMVLFLLGATVLLLLCVIPILGYIACLVGVVMGTAFYYMALLRVATTGKVASAFDLSELFRAYRKNLGSLVFSTFIPSLIGGLVSSIIALVIFSIAALVSYSSIEHMTSYTYTYLMSNPLALITFSTSFLVAFVFAFLIALLVQGFIELWTMRAVGHWVNRTVPEWAAEAEGAADSEDAAADAASGAEGEASAE